MGKGTTGQARNEEILRITVTLQQLVQLLIDKHIDSTLADCLRDIAASYEMTTEQTTEREFKVKQHLLQCAERLDHGN